MEKKRKRLYNKNKWDFFYFLACHVRFSHNFDVKKTVWDIIIFELVAYEKESRVFVEIVVHGPVSIGNFVGTLLYLQYTYNLHCKKELVKYYA